MTWVTHSHRLQVAKLRKTDLTLRAIIAKTLPTVPAVVNFSDKSLEFQVTTSAVESQMIGYPNWRSLDPLRIKGSCFVLVFSFVL
jgi:hypothetical protein